MVVNLSLLEGCQNAPINRGVKMPLSCFKIKLHQPYLFCYFDIFISMTNEELVIKKDINSLISNNMGLVHYIAKQMYQYDPDVYEDLLQAGRIGIYEAMLHYQEGQGRGSGATFATYAKIWIKKEINDYMTNNSRTIRLPQNKIYELRRENNLPRPCLSIDEPINGTRGDFSNHTLADVIPNEEPMAQPDYTDLIISIDNLKKDLHKDVIRRYYGLEPYNKKYTLDDIAAIYGMSREGIRNNLIRARKLLSANTKLRDLLN